MSQESNFPLYFGPDAGPGARLLSSCASHLNPQRALLQITN